MSPPTPCTRTSPRSIWPAGSCARSRSWPRRSSGAPGRWSISIRAGPPMCWTRGVAAGARCARRCLRPRLWCRRESGLLVRAVAEGLAAGLAAPAEGDRAARVLDRRARAVEEAEWPAHEQRPVAVGRYQDGVLDAGVGRWHGLGADRFWVSLLTRGL